MSFESLKTQASSVRSLTELVNIITENWHEMYKLSHSSLCDCPCSTNSASFLAIPTKFPDEVLRAIFSMVAVTDDFPAADRVDFVSMMVTLPFHQFISSQSPSIFRIENNWRNHLDSTGNKHRWFRTWRCEMGFTASDWPTLAKLVEINQTAGVILGKDIHDIK